MVEPAGPYTPPVRTSGFFYVLQPQRRRGPVFAASAGRRRLSGQRRKDDSMTATLVAKDISGGHGHRGFSLSGLSLASVRRDAYPKGRGKLLSWG